MHETFAPSGPWLATADEIADPMRLSIEIRVNGTSRHRFSTASLSVTIPRLVATLSRATLQAGDVIWCGPPAASVDEVQVRIDDEVESIVEGVGTIRNRVVK